MSDALSASKRMEEEYRKEKSLYMLYVNLEKTFDRVPKKS